MNERQKVNKIIHTYVEVNKCEDYTDYKGLITALINWKNEQLTLTDVSNRRELLIAYEKNHYTPQEWVLASKQCIEDIDNFLAINCG